MRPIALFTALALAAPLAADAQPRPDPRSSYDRDHDRDRDRDRDRWRDRDHDRDRGAWHREPYDRFDNSRWTRDFRWVPIWHGFTTMRDRQYIPVRGGAWDRLRIEANAGTPVILRIAIEFMNRTTQVIDMNVVLRPGGGQVIDLPGRDRRISRIIVYSDPRSRGTYSIYGT